MAWDLSTAWTETTAVVAAVYGVDIAAVRAPSRGRGPRPLAAVVEPRKLALYVTLCLAECDYAALGRHVGLHRDTVASHAAEIREGAMKDDAELVLERLEAAAGERLRSSANVIAARLRVAAKLASEGDVASALRLAGSLTSSDTSSDSSSDKGCGRASHPRARVA